MCNTAEKGETQKEIKSQTMYRDGEKERKKERDGRKEQINRKGGGGGDRVRQRF